MLCISLNILPHWHWRARAVCGWGHANLLCIVPILTDDPRRESEGGEEKERREVVRARRTEVIASRSELLSLHCPRHLLLLALLPACAVSQVIMRQDCSAYAEEPLRTVGLLEAAHQYSVQDMHGSARTPAPAPPRILG